MSIDHLNKIRDKIGKEFDEASWYGRRSLDYFEAGFDASTEHWRKIAGELETALIEIIDINHCDLEMDATWRERRAIKAIDEYRKQIGGADEM